MLPIACSSRAIDTKIYQRLSTLWHCPALPLTWCSCFSYWQQIEVQAFFFACQVGGQIHLANASSELVRLISAAGIGKAILSHEIV